MAVGMFCGSLGYMDGIGMCVLFAVNPFRFICCGIESPLYVFMGFGNRTIARNSFLHICIGIGWQLCCRILFYCVTCDA